MQSLREDNWDVVVVVGVGVVGVAVRVSLRMVVGNGKRDKHGANGEELMGCHVLEQSGVRVKI